MNVAIIAGGRGTRLAERPDAVPKALVQIGGRPILWHIMRHYAVYRHRRFVVALGHGGDLIRKYFAAERGNGVVSARAKEGSAGEWQVELVDTGIDTQNGGRIKRLAPRLGRSTFMVTWTDGVADVDLDALLRFHHSHGKLATLTAVRPPARFGHLDLDGDRVVHFAEKPHASEGWINGGFFVLEPGALDYIDGDATEWEREPLERLSADGELMAFRHPSFWQCMDTLHDHRRLEQAWTSGEAPWKTWAD